MKFTRLRLTGFKSFVEPSEFLIEPGLTGVVGPNGCGKSNLVEALRWVMGENSYKNMRASGMDDVIFSGSGQRPARNSAEVGLFIDNSDRTAPATFNDADELQVTRRIEREQGSVYRINGKEARARDVQLLFADASTGARSPSMVGQGRIGELIQSKPQARRQLLEEAAGISGLHSRRHEAELRLKAAETNLERLEDITSQLATQIDSLKRQARQANRFKQLSAAIRAEEAKLLHIRWAQAKAAEGEAESVLNQATSLVAERAQAQMETAKDQAVHGLKLPELRNAEAEAAAALQRLTIALAQLDEEARRISSRRRDLERRISQLADDIRREEQMIAGNAGIIQKLDEEEEALSEAIENSAAQTEELRAALEDARLAASEAEAAMQRLTAERAEAMAGRQQIERLLGELSQRRLRLDQQRRLATDELDVIEGKLAALPDPAEKQAELEAAELAQADGDRALAVVERALAEARSAEQEARRPVEEARARLRAIETEASTISRMLAAGSSARTPVAEKIQADRGLETAVGAVLGDDLDSSLDAADPAYWTLSGPGDQDPALPAGVTALSAHVRAPAELSRRLRQIGLVDDDAGGALMAQLKAGQRLVSRAGTVWRWDGHVVRAGAPSAAALRLQQKNRLAALADERAEAEVVLFDCEARLEDALNAVRTEDERLAATREMIRLLARKLTDAREAALTAERAAADLIRRKDTASQQLESLASQIEEVEIGEEDARIALGDLPDFAGLELSLREQSAVVAERRAAFAEARALADAEARDNDARRRRITAIAAERMVWHEREASASGQIERLTERQDEARMELEDLIAAPEEMEDRRRALVGEIARADAARKAAADRLAAQENAQREADRVAQTALAALAEAREQRGRAEERLVSAREWRLAQEARIREALNVEPHMVLRLAGLSPEDKLPSDVRGIEVEVERLKMERDRLGAVNLRAEEEQAELSAQLDGLVRERDDIIDAIRKLRGAIQSLNREGRERLMGAFDEVNSQFKRLFTHLFNGGEAELQLIESDDPLEAGLEILARPPGKKPQTMTLLSGGEQALTAMALIFAVFLTNPAPICVLDEVDAPLDDHNVERYCNLMDEMAATTETRFLIITHNPITMARMNRLYGVTMAEQGVSQLVSVDLQTAERLVEVA